MPFAAHRLWELLGVPGGAHTAATHDIIKTDTSGRHTAQHLTLHFTTGDAPAIFLRPKGDGPFPAVLYCHAHGNVYTVGSAELTEGRPALQRPYGPDLCDLGIACLAVDMPGFGGRQGERGEAALAKAAHWHGTTLMGQMLAEYAAAFHWLAARPEVAPDRIATLGLSMGATHAYWLAALLSEVAATAHLCAFADIAPLIKTGTHDLHGPYMTVPGLLAEGDMGDVAAAIAPRPQLICGGSADPLTPPDAFEPAVARVRAAYGNDGPLSVLYTEGSGHIETPEMRAAVLRFLSDHLFS